MQDIETELYYLQSRYYEPEVGRFLNADAFASTGQGITGTNMFAYCGNNPVNCSDPTGELGLLVVLLEKVKEAAVDHYFPSIKVYYGVSTFIECMDSGAGLGKSLLAGAISLYAAYAITPTGKENIPRFVELVFGLGTSLVSAGVTEGVKRSATNGAAVFKSQRPLESKIPLSPSGAVGCGGDILQIAF